MNRELWSRALGLATTIGLLSSCGSDGSLASSGSGDWVFDGSQIGGRSSGSTSSATSGGVGGERAAVSGGGAGAVPSVTTGGQMPGNSAGTATSGAAGSASPTGGAGRSSSGGGAANSGGGYHQLLNWVEPLAGNPNHHGRMYFLGNAHKDENGVLCTSCHGANYEGDSGPACSSCHDQWRSSCTFCHGNAGVAGMLGAAPPRGIWDENSTASLAVGRHAAHLSTGASHQAFACTTCHELPASNDVDHTLSYQASVDLSTPGHHGDVSLSGALPGMAFKLDATTGTPISARGSCVGGCHSDGRGGAPLKTPYWAGGSWTSSCGNCHAARPNSGHHGHAMGEGNATCKDCHAGSTTDAYSASTHLDGQVQYMATVSGQGMTLTADAKCQSGVRCNGTCHGNSEGHNNQCW